MLDVRSLAVGAAAVLGVLVVGFGGGVLMGGILSGGDKAPNKVERQAAGKEEKPIAPAAAPVTRPAEVQPTAVATPKPAVTAPSTEQPQTPPASPPQTIMRADVSPPTPPEPTTAVAAATAVGSSLNSDVKLGPERPVALTQPVGQARPLSRREEARIRHEQRRAEREKRREERRRLIAERRDRDLLRREEMRSERLRRQQFDEDDDDDARPVARGVAPRAPDLPFFRIFGGN